MSGIAGGMVIVTGAATGVGRALALEAAKRCAEVLAVDVNDASETVGMITRSGGRASGALADVTDLAALETLRPKFAVKPARLTSSVLTPGQVSAEPSTRSRVNRSARYSTSTSSVRSTLCGPSCPLSDEHEPLGAAPRC
jgi:nucleoside-diphosphate-sugar epimerase